MSVKFIKNLKKFFQSPEPPNFYQLLGEEAGIRALINDFYRVMETDLKAKECLLIHELKDGLVSEDTKEKFFYFLSGWLGGPNLFVQKVGPPMMRKRHIHLPIRNREKEQWLYCMSRALKERKLKKKHKILLMNSFTALAMRIQNKN